MPLNWDATRCDPSVLTEELHYRTSQFAFVLMAIGAASITEKNYQELYTRGVMFEKLFGAFFYHWDDQNQQIEEPLTLEDWKLRIGYRTNNSTLTKRQFLTKVENRFFEDQLAIAGR